MWNFIQMAIEDVQSRLCSCPGDLQLKNDWRKKMDAIFSMREHRRLKCSPSKILITLTIHCSTSSVQSAPVPLTTSQYLISRTCSLMNEANETSNGVYRRKFHSFPPENFSSAAMVFLTGSCLARSPFSVRRQGWSGEMRWPWPTASECPSLTRAVSPEAVEYKKRN